MLILNVHLVQGAIEKYNNIAKEIKFKKKKKTVKVKSMQTKVEENGYAFGCECWAK